MVKKAASKATRKSASINKTKTEKNKKTFKASEILKSENVTAQRSLKVKRSYAITVLGILAIVALLYLGRNLIVAAIVNGQPISRIAVIRELEKQGGKQALDSLVTKQLILQESRKKSISVSQKEIDDEMKKIEKNLEAQGQKLDQVLALQGMTKDTLVEQIKLQKMLEKMVGKIEVTEKEIDEYIEENIDSLPQDQEEATLRSNVKNSLTQQKLNTKAQEILENLRKNAKINYFVQY